MSKTLKLLRSQFSHQLIWYQRGYMKIYFVDDRVLYNVGSFSAESPLSNTTFQENASYSFHTSFLRPCLKSPAGGGVLLVCSQRTINILLWYSLIFPCSFAWGTRLWSCWRLGICLTQFCSPTRELWAQCLFSKCLLSEWIHKWMNTWMGAVSILWRGYLCSVFVISLWTESSLKEGPWVIHICIPIVPCTWYRTDIYRKLNRKM